MYLDENNVLSDEQSLSGASVTSTNNVDLGTPMNIATATRTISLVTDGNVAGPTTVQVVVEGSNDASTWTTIVTREWSLTDFNDQSVKSIPFPWEKNRYFRLKYEGNAPYTAGKVSAFIPESAPVAEVYGA